MLLLLYFPRIALNKNHYLNCIEQETLNIILLLEQFQDQDILQDQQK